MSEISYTLAPMLFFLVCPQVGTSGDITGLDGLSKQGG